MTFFVEFLEREPFYTHDNVFTPKVPIWKKKNQFYATPCMYSKTMKQWSRWSWKEGVQQWDMFPGPTELHLIGYLIELISIPRSNLNTSTPKTNLLTFWPNEVSRVMSGIICCACLTLVISVLQFALLQWRTDLNKIQEKNESQRNQNLWWILLWRRHRSSRLRLHWALGRDITENKILGSPLLQKIDQGNLIASLQQIIQNWIITVLCFLKNGKLRLRRTIDQDNLIKLFGEWYNKFVLITKQLFSTEPRNP